VTHPTWLEGWSGDEAVRVWQPAPGRRIADLGSIGKEGNGFALAARLRTPLPGVERAQAESLMQQAHEVCPAPKPPAILSIPAAEGRGPG
jgi:hypothetical protein